MPCLIVVIFIGISCENAHECVRIMCGWMRLVD